MSSKGVRSMFNQLGVSSVIGSRCASTDSLSLTVSAAAFVDLPYSPALLLDSSFSATITDDSEFHTACESAFDAYFEEMYELDGNKSVFVEKFYSGSDMVIFVLENVLHWKEDDRLAGLSSVAWDAGFALGWLSAHALVDRPASLLALEVLRALIECLSCQDIKR